LTITRSDVAEFVLTALILTAALIVLDGRWYVWLVYATVLAIVLYPWLRRRAPFWRQLLAGIAGGAVATVIYQAWMRL